MIHQEFFEAMIGLSPEEIEGMLMSSQHATSIEDTKAFSEFIAAVCAQMA